MKRTKNNHIMKRTKYAARSNGVSLKEYLPLINMRPYADPNLPRPSKTYKGKYQPHMAEEAQELVGKLGARQCDLAEYFEVDESTVDNWMRIHPDFKRAVKRGRLEAGLKMAQALFQKGLGYSHPDVHITSHQGNIQVTPIMKHYPPDTQAAVKYLSIIFREYWAETMNVDHTIRGTITHKKVEELSLDNIPDEVKQLLFDIHLQQLSDAQSN